MNLRYLILRLARHFMPEGMARLLLKHRWIIRPGLESSDPHAAVEQYLKALTERGVSLNGQRVLVFGYGGRFAVGMQLLERGASHVVLCDHFVLLDRERNLELLPKYEKYLHMVGDEVMPRPEQVTLLHGDIREEKVQAEIQAVDLVLSTSVYEHLGDVKGITAALAKLTSPGGTHLHFIDLRDHYFKYPFEMLTFSEDVWRSFLNPTSNLNRLRLNDYSEVFNTHFQKVEITVLKRLPDEFRLARPRIRPEFMTGDEAVDSTALIALFSQHPHKK